MFGGRLGTGDAVRSLDLPSAGECIRKGCVSVMGDMVPPFELSEDKVPSASGFSASAFPDMWWA